ncbi:MAG: glucose 1-dehydrogenase [Thermoplasmataceae archaeon]
MVEGLKGKVAMVTGSGSGIGKSTALLLAHEGAHVVVSEFSEQTGRETARLIRDSGGSAEFVRTDVSQDSSCAAAVNFAIEKFHGLDVLVNNAGVDSSEPRLLAETSVDEFDRIMGVNLRGAWLMSRHAIPAMIEHHGGVIVNMASIGGMIPIPTGMPYSVSKAGLIMLTKSIAVEYGKQGIRANAIAPGWISTSMPRRFTDASNIRFEDFVQSVSRRTPISRLGNPEEIAKLVLFLASEESSYITGQTYVIDGGLSIT